MVTIGIDCETSKEPVFHPWQKDAFLVAVGVAKENGWTKTWVFNHKDYVPEKTQRQMLDEIQAIVNTADRVVGCNLKFDLNWMSSLGINFDHCKFWCNQVTEYLLLGQRALGKLKLAYLSKKYLNTEKIDRMEAYWDAGFQTNEIPLSILLPYLEQDCINALAVFQRQVPLVAKENMEALVSLQNESTRILSSIELTGMKFDEQVARGHVERLKGELEFIDIDLKAAFEFDINFNSNDELSAALYGGIVKREIEEWVIKEYKYWSRYYPRKAIEEIKLAGIFKPPRGSELKKKGYYSTDKNALAALKCANKKQIKVKELLERRSKAKKALETFVGKDEAEGKGLINKIQADGCIHSQYNQTVTKTGRLSSSDPNGQNLPRKGTSPIKESIIPRFDKILSADLSQIEWRAAAFLSQDPVMLDEIYNGFDPHRDNAIHIFGADPDNADFDHIRTIAKICSFRLLYGGAAYGFYLDAKMPNYSLKRWKEIVELFYEKYPVLKKWQDENIRAVYKNEGTLKLFTGRQFRIESDEGGYFERQIKNFPVQALATADIMPLAMTVIFRRYKKMHLKSKIIAQVHDSLIWDVVEDEIEVVAQLCINVFKSLPNLIERFWGVKFNVPLTGEIEIGPDYGHLVKLERIP